MTQAQEQEKAAQRAGADRRARMPTKTCTRTIKIVQLYRSGYLDEAQQDRDISQYAYQRGAASLLDYLDAERSYRATQLAYRQSLASYLHRAGTAARGSWNKELAMKFSTKFATIARRKSDFAMSRRWGFAVGLAGCSSGGTASQMTSFSGNTSPAEQPRCSRSRKTRCRTCRWSPFSRRS